jgi:hypothetical protein
MPRLCRGSQDAAKPRTAGAFSCADGLACRPLRPHHGAGTDPEDSHALGRPLEPPLRSPARGPPTDWGELIQADDDRYVVQTSPAELPGIAVNSL